MRILLISQWFEPEAHYKGLVFAKALEARGHRVTVLTGFPNYPGGKLYAGYPLRPYRRDVVDGIVVHRAPLYPSHGRSSVGRALNYISFALAAAVIALFLRRPDVCYVYTPPATAALPAWVLRWVRDVPYLVDIQDLWPDTLAATGMVNNDAVLRAVGAWTSLSLRHAARIAVLSPGFSERLLTRGFAVDKVETIPNWSTDIPPAEPGEIAALGIPADRFAIFFAGNMGKAQGLDCVLDAARLLADKVPTIELVLVGSGVELDRLKARAAAHELPNVRFLPRRPAEAMGAVYDRADALLVHLNNDPLFAITIPSKTQSYLLAGKPILMGVAGDAADLVRNAGAGITFSPEQPGALAAAALELYAMQPEERDVLGRNGTAYYKANLSFSAGVDRFEALLRAAAGLSAS